MRRLVLALSLSAAAAMTLPASADRPAWVPTYPIADPGFIALSAPSPRTVFLGFGGSNAALVRSDDGGQTWASLTPPPEAFSAVTRFASPRTGWSVNTFGAAVTRDGARTWRAVRLPQRGGGNTLIDVSARGQHVVMVGDAYARLRSGCNTPQPSTWSSHDDGRTWRRAALTGRTQPYLVRMHDSRHGLLLAHDLARVANPCRDIVQPPTSSVWVTHDGARSWRRSMTCRRYCTVAATLAPSTFVVAGESGRTFRTVDGGRRWRESGRLVVPGAPDTSETGVLQAQGMDFADAAVGFASTRGGGNWRTTDGGRTWTMEVADSIAHTSFGSGDLVALNREHAVAVTPRFASVRRGLP